MESEALRLESFAEWPQNAPVEPIFLAKHGFYSTGQYLEARCHWCQSIIYDWDYGDMVWERHRKIAPTCAFIVNYETCGNIPLESNNAIPEPDMYSEHDRLTTFKKWPNPNIQPQSLAKAGFFYLKRSDEVKCAWCHGIVAKWMPGDDAFKEHQRLFPECPRAKLGPLVSVADGLNALCIQTIAPPKNPKYASLDARIRTFANWPTENVQQPLLLARAGLYYQGFEDQVHCFQCNIGLRFWQKDDDPLAEHAKWSPECHFVRLALGNSPASPTGSGTRVQGAEATKNTTSNNDSTTNNDNRANNDNRGNNDELPTSTSRLAQPGGAAGGVSPNDDSTTTAEKKEPAPAAEPLKEDAKVEDEYLHLKEARLCKVCLDEEVGVVFLPCGHLVTCFQCAPSITHCPICRSPIKGVVRAYLS